ncbi:MAG: methyltransferase domain-containing protein [Dysosmobacter sp.]
MKPKFDGYAAQYDAWFMENENLFQSELRLFQKVLGDIQGKRVLSVGRGSGLFESMIDCGGIEGIEPSRDMGAIAEKRGVNVVAFGAIEDAELEENAYDMIYLNGSSSYMEDLTRAFDVCKKRPQAKRHFYFAGCPQGERLWVHVSAGKRGRHL